MNCKDFWKIYEETGLTPELEQHLSECANCAHEMLIEHNIEKIAQKLPQFDAPDSIWEAVMPYIQQNPIKTARKRSFWEIISRVVKEALIPSQSHFLRPALTYISVVILTIGAIMYYSTSQHSHRNKDWLQAKAIQKIEKTEQEYLIAIEKFTTIVDSQKDTIDPVLLDLYQRKLALLDEYIDQCKDAVRQNEYNPVPRRYLALAYKEKVETLREMSEKI